MEVLPFSSISCFRISPQLSSAGSIKILACFILFARDECMCGTSSDLAKAVVF